MTQQMIPEGWKNKDIRVIVPKDAAPDVVKFCEGILREKNPDNIAKRAVEALKQWDAEFAANDTHLPFFGYLLEYQYGLGNLPKLVDGLKKPLPKTLRDVLPEACIVKLSEFYEGVQDNTLIVEPGKMVVTMLRERVLEPFREQILAADTGVTDLHFIAINLCSTLGIDPN